VFGKNDGKCDREMITRGHDHDHNQEMTAAKERGMEMEGERGNKDTERVERAIDNSSAS
jgi:hypothetical protein